MQTYSHLIIAALVAQRLNKRSINDGARQNGTENIPALSTGSFLLGSVAPDIPLILLTALFLASDMLSGTAGEDGSSVEHLFRYRFYHDPWVMSAHNLFHAPLMILLYGIIGYLAWRRGARWGVALFWFATACMIHTLIDIPLHYDDGPLVFWPLDWETRFYSPISYWDPRRYGIPAAIVEHVLILGMLSAFVVNWRRQRRDRRRVQVVKAD